MGANHRIPSWMEEAGERTASQGCLFLTGHAVSVPFWSSLLSCVGLVIMTMGERTLDDDRGRSVAHHGSELAAFLHQD
jgi:hypothetical protein